MRYPRRVPSKKYALLAVALVALVIGAWWGWGEQDKRSQRADIEAALADTTARLRDSLAVAPNAMGKRALPRIDEHVAAVEKHLERVRRAAARVPELASGAELYLIGAHAILKRQAAGIRQAEASAAGRAALIGHMRRAARRDAAWIREAMTQKKAVEAQYFDYGLTLKALADLLGSFPETRAPLAGHVDADAMLEDGPAQEQRALVLKESRRVADELDGIRRLR